MSKGRVQENSGHNKIPRLQECRIPADGEFCCKIEDGEADTSPSTHETFSQLLLAIGVGVAAEILSYYIIKWLESK